MRRESLVKHSLFNRDQGFAAATKTKSLVRFAIRSAWESQWQQQISKTKKTNALKTYIIVHE